MINTICVVVEKSPYLLSLDKISVKYSKKRKKWNGRISYRLNDDADRFPMCHVRMTAQSEE